MFYITGDTHGDLDFDKLRLHNLTQQGIQIPSKDDKLIILGDFGLPFITPENMKPHTLQVYQECMDFLDKYPCQVLWIDGNHDNHDFWAKQPITHMYDGKVQIHPLSSNVIHLMRGQVYDIDNTSVFTLGGASSIDKCLRIEGYSWWEQEEVSNKECEEALNNLHKYNNEVDIILTHTMPWSLIQEYEFKPFPDKTAQFLDIIYNNGLGKDKYGGVTYKQWFCGHFHEDRIMGKRLNCLYNNFIIYDKSREKENEEEREERE